jgi:serine palmitoyltransferase
MNKKTEIVTQIQIERLQEPPLYIMLFCYLSYAILILFGYLRDFLRRTGIEQNKAAVEANREVSLD